MFPIRSMDLRCLMIKVKVLSLEFEALQIWQYLPCLILPHLLLSTPGCRHPGALPPLPSTYTFHLSSPQALCIRFLLPGILFWTICPLHSRAFLGRNAYAPLLFPQGREARWRVSTPSRGKEKKREISALLSTFRREGMTGDQDLGTLAQPSLPPSLEGPLCLQINAVLSGSYQLLPRSSHSPPISVHGLPLRQAWPAPVMPPQEAASHICSADPALASQGPPKLQTKGRGRGPHPPIQRKQQERWWVSSSI